MNTKYIWLLLILITFSACNDPEDVIRDFNLETGIAESLPELTSGTADFSNYVAVGASFTSGFTDGGLFIAAQENSFPNILSKEFVKIGGGTFTQPLVEDNTGGILVGGNLVTDYRLVFGGAGPVRLDNFLESESIPVPNVTTEAGINIGSDFNNFGIPGAKSFHLITPGYAAFNPYYARIASAGTATVLDDAAAQNPTFFTLSEIGGNDVLGYATSGGESDSSALNFDPITPVGQFDTAFNQLIDNLTSGGAKGAVTNVPYITDLPHFTTVPYNPIPLDGATSNFLNSISAYGAYNAGLDATLAFLLSNNGTNTLNALFPETSNMTPQELAEAEITKRKINFTASENNAVVIIDEDLTDLTGINPALLSIRQATSEDLFVLPSSSFIGTEAIPGNPTTVNGVGIPLEDKWVLTPEEQLAIKTATDAYNATIASIANSNANIALVDLNSILTELASTGVTFDEYTMTANLVTGGAVSLDGIHLTARGYAFMANKFLEKIDETFGSNFIESGNVAAAGDYPTNYAPTLQ